MRAFLILFLLLASQARAEGPEADFEFFETRIRPVLIAHCYECHSASAKVLQGGLRLDTRSTSRRGGDSGAAVIPQDTENSLLLSALRYDDLQMPPSGRLPQRVIDDFQQWIEMGAPDPRQKIHPPELPAANTVSQPHWAYQPLTVAAPESDLAWPANSPIDSLILAQLRRQKLTQVAVAQDRTFVRRLYFDLTGLPPTPRQIETFLHDQTPDAKARLSDRLLASLQFGEKWGRHWLDVVRFAESITLRGTLFPHAWRYRDYVIATFNADQPFNHFVRQQVAGDLLTAETRAEKQQNLIATTFLTLGNNNLEDQDKQKLQMDVVDEQLTVIGKGFLAQTISCARCHDHKFDPIPTRDYYALAGILRNTKTLQHANVSKWIELPLPLSAAASAEFEKYTGQITERKKKLDALNAQLEKVGPLPVDQLPGIVVDDLQARLSGSWQPSTFTATYVGQGYQHDMANAKGQKEAIFQPPMALDGKYEVRFAYTPGSNRSPAVAIKVTSAEGVATVTINQKVKPPLNGHFISLGQYHFTPAAIPTVSVSNLGTKEFVIIDAVQFLPVALAKSTAKPAEKTIAIQDQIKELTAELEALKKKLPARPMTMSITEEETIGDTEIRIRGNVHNLGEIASRGFLQVVRTEIQPHFTTQESGRRELGNWITAVDNPLTSRVICNRLWHWLFGQGIVRTTDNFGTTGEMPSHPQLLDYLATRLVQKKWSLKSILREMVNSQTYRLSTDLHQANAALDPENRWLWRMNRRRLSAEQLLDAMLAVSGHLDTTLGGKTIRAATPNDYNYQHTSFQRAVYWPVLRNSLPDAFEVFDFANPSMVVGQRNISSTAPQALFFLNNPWLMQQADHLAENLLAMPAFDDEQRLEWLAQATLGRSLLPTERTLVLDFLSNSTTDLDAQQSLWRQVAHTFFASLDFRYID